MLIPSLDIFLGLVDLSSIKPILYTNVDKTALYKFLVIIFFFLEYVDVLSYIYPFHHFNLFSSGQDGI